jgi:hypothetical protein
MTKKDQLVEAVKSDDFKKALGIAKTFTRNFDKDEQRIIQIAHETISGKGSFYAMLKIDTEQMVEDAIELLKKFVQDK